ncbi:MAG: hypothetical protein ACMG6S_17005 [Byssovorax sp.]
MKLDELVSPTDLRDFAKARGWTLVAEGLKDRLYVMSHPDFAKRQLVFPIDITAPDYAEAVAIALEKLGGIEARLPEAVLNSVLEVRDDAMAFRVTTPQPSERSIPLPFAGAMLVGVEQMLKASACTVLRPQIHHPRLGRSEALQLVEAARFRHTRPGSFVLNVSCPVTAFDAQGTLPIAGQTVPFVRQATSILNKSLRALVEAIEADTLDHFVTEMKRDPTPSVSSNFCEALTRFKDDTIKSSVEVSITWAAVIARPAGEPPTSVVRVQHDYFSRIEEVAQELRPATPHAEDTFVGTVEGLEGEMGPDNQRSGPVILSLLLPEGEQVRARVNLDAKQYAEADKAHMTEGIYVKVRGRLHPGRQPRQMSDVASFELIPR